MTLLRTVRLALAFLICSLSLYLMTGCSGVSSGSGADPASTYSISGTINPASNGNGSTVTLSGAAQATATADASGNYSFSALANGSYTVTPSKKGFDFGPTHINVTVKDADAKGQNFTISAASTRTISGSITPASSGSGATVTLSGDADATTTADTSGNYRFDKLIDGSYTVTPSKAGFAFNPYSLEVALSGGNVQNLDFTGIAGCSSGHGTADFYVAPQGNDAWSGTLDCPNSDNTDGPFASIAKAQQAVRSANHGAPLTVMVRAGTYYLALSPTNPGTLNFAATDSGSASAPVTWENYPDESPVISGGLPVSGWTHVSGNLWQVQLPATLKPFEFLYYNGERRLRSRPQSSSGVGYTMNGGACISTVTGDSVDIGLCNLGTYLRIAAEVPPTGANANCPSVTRSDGSESKCLDRFLYDPNDPIERWANLHPPSGNPCNAPSSGSYPAGDVELTLFSAYTVDVMRISCVDTSKHMIYLTGATGKGSTSQYDFTGPAADHRYIVENAKEAFDASQAAGQTGIWFLDRSTSPWTLNYLAGGSENPDTDTVVIGQLGEAIPGEPASDFTGASLMFANGLNYVIFSGLTFEVDNYIPSATGFNNDSNGEFAVPQAIDCESCQNVTFDGITIRHTSGSAILLAGTGGNSGAPAANDLIQNSAFYDLGSSGVRIGHSPSGGDRPGFVPQFITVQNNIIQGYSRVFADGEGIAMGNGHDVTFQHNDINDGYHAAVSICVWGCYSYQWSANGINIVTQYNHLWNIMQGVTSDGGALYYNIGTNTGSGTGDQILNNLIHEVSDASVIDDGVIGSGYGGHGIYLDIQSSGMTIANNVIYHVASSGLVMTQGPSPGKGANSFNNNIVAYARKSIFQEQNPWPQDCTTTLRAGLSNNLFYFDKDDTSGFYAISGCTDSCGMAYNKFQYFQGNLYWRTDGGFATYDKAFHLLTNPPPPNQASTCGQIQNPQFTFLTAAQWQNSIQTINGQPLTVHEDVGGTVSVNPGFGNTGQPSDFLLSSAPVSGFDFSLTNDTINNAGRNNPVIQPPVVPPTFPTYAYPSDMF